jgi:hypothetical protein
MLLRREDGIKCAPSEYWNHEDLSNHVFKVRLAGHASMQERQFQDCTIYRRLWRQFQTNRFRSPHCYNYRRTRNGSIVCQSRWLGALHLDVVIPLMQSGIGTGEGARNLEVLLSEQAWRRPDVSQRGHLLIKPAVLVMDNRARVERQAVSCAPETIFEDRLRPKVVVRGSEYHCHSTSRVKIPRTRGPNLLQLKSHTI